MISVAGTTDSRGRLSSSAVSWGRVAVWQDVAGAGGAAAGANRAAGCATGAADALAHQKPASRDPKANQPRHGAGFNLAHPPLPPHTPMLNAPAIQLNA